MGDDILKSSSSEETNGGNPIGGFAAKALQHLQSNESRPTKRKATAIGKSDQSSSSSPRYETKILHKKRSTRAANNANGISKRKREIPSEDDDDDESRAQAVVALSTAEEKKRSGSSKYPPEVVDASQNPAYRGVVSQLQHQHGQLEQLLRVPSAVPSLNLQAPPLTAAEQIILLTAQRRSSPFPQTIEYQQQQHQQLQILMHLQQQQQAQQMGGRSVASLAHAPFTVGEGGSLGRALPINFSPYAAANLANLGGGLSRGMPIESSGANLSHPNLLPTALAAPGRLSRFAEPSLGDFGGIQDPASASSELLASLLPASASGSRDIIAAEIPETPRNPELEWRSVQLCQQAQEFIEAWKASQDAETLEELKQEGRWNRKRKAPKKKR